MVGQGRVVGVPTGYGLDDPGVESRSMRDLAALEPTQPSIQCVACYFPRGRSGGAWR